jgi:hypothetical protein
VSETTRIAATTMIARARAGLQNTNVRSQTSAAAADRIKRFGCRNRGAASAEEIPGDEISVIRAGDKEDLIPARPGRERTHGLACRLGQLPGVKRAPAWFSARLLKIRHHHLSVFAGECKAEAFRLFAQRERGVACG